MKILNLYAGIGGNRTLWGDDHDITAVENDPDVAYVYHKRFPGDDVVIADAHSFLLHNYKDFDFIWSSPPCITHSRLNLAMKSDRYRKGIVRYPDMNLWAEIIFLKHYGFRAAWVVENVIPYYEPLVTPTATIGRHLFWSNLPLRSESRPAGQIENYNRLEFCKKFSVDPELLKGFKGNKPRQLLRNCVDPQLGGAILDLTLGKKQEQRHQLALDLGAEI